MFLLIFYYSSQRIIFIYLFSNGNGENKEAFFQDIFYLAI